MLVARTPENHISTICFFSLECRRQTRGSWEGEEESRGLTNAENLA